MQKKTDGLLTWLEFDLLSEIPGLSHGIYLRHGGVSQEPFASLNAGMHVGDDPAKVQSNLATIQTHMQQKNPRSKKLVRGRCVHGTSIAAIDRDSCEEISECDGLTTDVPGISLMMTHADCQVALFYDPENRAIANIHAGWRGNVQNIYAKAVREMQTTFGSKPANLLVGITPSLGPDEAEFLNYANEFPETFWKFQVKPKFFDLWSLAEEQLQAAGLLPHHIEVARISTYANPQDFFSYRRQNHTGRHAACIAISC